MGKPMKLKGRKNFYGEVTNARGERQRRSTGTDDYERAKAILERRADDVVLARAGFVDQEDLDEKEAGEAQLSKHVADYLRSCRRRGGKSHNSQKAKRLQSFVEFTGDALLRCVTPCDLEKWMQSLDDRELSARTVNSYRQDVVAFANWCVSVGRLRRNRFEKIAKFRESARTKRRDRRALRDDEVERLLQAGGESGRRLWYALAVMAGLRLGEIRRLMWGDIDLDGAVLVVREGKNGHDDEVPLHPELVRELRAVRPLGARSVDPVCARNLNQRQRVRDFERARILSPDERGRVADFHALRTTFATRLAREGVSPQLAQRLLRHADIGTTMKYYTRLETEDAARALSEVSAFGAMSRYSVVQFGDEGVEAGHSCDPMFTTIDLSKGVAPGDLAWHWGWCPACYGLGISA